MDRQLIFDILYACAACDGREERIFGDCGADVRRAFAASLAGNSFPEVWLEAPLTGAPWTDFHSLVSHDDVAGTDATYAGHDGVYADALAWFAAQRPGTVRQLALSYDTSAGIVDAPAVQVLLNGRDESVPLGFLDAVGREDARGAYRTFVRSMPDDWYACYVGAFPQRRDDFVRVECIQEGELQAAYAHDVDTLAHDLALVGMSEVDKSALEVISGLAGMPFPLELQFNVGMDGSALPAVSASLRFGPRDWTDPERFGKIGALGAWLAARGLADDRLGVLPGTAFAKRLTREGSQVSLSCYPAFVKVRWREGEPLDAKTYLIGTVKEGE